MAPLRFQQIRGDCYELSLAAEQMVSPRSVTVLGQEFIVDSWVFSSIVYDSVIWDDDGIPTESDKVPRRIPGGLDVACAVV